VSTKPTASILSGEEIASILAERGEDANAERVEQVRSHILEDRLARLPEDEHPAALRHAIDLLARQLAEDPTASLQVVSAFGDWSPDVPKGMVGVYAAAGGERSGPKSRWLVPKGEYRATRLLKTAADSGGMFVIAPDRHQRLADTFEFGFDRKSEITQPLVGSEAWTTAVRQNGQVVVTPCVITSLGEWTMDRDAKPWRKISLFLPGFNGGTTNITVDAARVFVDRDTSIPIDVGPAPSLKSLQALRAAAYSQTSAFDVSDEDVAAVLLSYGDRVENARSLSTFDLAEDLLKTLDQAAIAVAALNGGDDLDLQASAAREEIKRQLLALGVLKAFNPAPASSVRLEEHLTPVIFESMWEEGTVSTKANLNLKTGEVVDIVAADEGDDYEHLISENIVVIVSHPAPGKGSPLTSIDVPVARNEDGRYFISAPDLASVNAAAAPVMQPENEKSLSVTSITIEGSTLRDMYDEHPGLAYFDSPSSLGVRVRKPLPMTEAMEAAMAAWSKVCGESDSNEFDDDDEYDGKFTATQIVLRNGAQEVVQQYDGEKWITDFVPAETWPDLLEKANSLDEEASEEARWDNFSTAQGLREQATELRRQVSIARANLPTSAAIAPLTLENPGTAPSASGDSFALSRNQILFAKRAAMATAFFVALSNDDDHGFDRLMTMRSVQEVKPSSDGWGEIFLHDHMKGWDLQALKNNVFGVALNLLHNLSGVSPELAGEQLNRYPTTIPLSPEGDLSHVPYHKVMVGSAGQNEPARDESPSLDM
jgi:hypothetical protein